MRRKINNTKGFAPLILLIVFVLVISVGAAAFYFGTRYQQSAPVEQMPIQPAEQWTGHDRFGVIFNVPANWYISANDSRVFKFVDDKGAILTEIGSADRDFASIKESSPTAQLINIGSNQAYKYENTYVLPLGIKGKQIISLNFFINNQKTIDEILKKIEFTEPSKIDYHDYWEEYHDGVNGYSFKYPAYFSVEEVKDATSSGVNVLKKNSGVKSKFVDVPDDVVITYRLFDAGMDAASFAEDFQIKLRPAVENGVVKSGGTTLREANFIKRQEMFINYNDERGSVQAEFMDLNGKVLQVMIYEANYKYQSYNLVSLLDQVVVRTKFD